MIDIKDNTGEVLYSTLINKGSKRKFEMMKEDYIMLKFSLDTPVDFAIGTYVECDFGRFEVVEEQSPSFNATNGGYDYELKLEAGYMKWRNKLFKYQPEVVGGNEASWSLTAPLSTHMDIFLRCLKSWAYKYNGYDYDYIIDTSVTTANIFLTYSNTNLIDALTMMAEATGCEWWVEGAGIYFGRKESDGEPVEVKIGNNAVSMQLSKSSGEYFTRIFAFGGMDNISPRYRKKLEFSVTSSSAGHVKDSARPITPSYFRKGLLAYDTWNRAVNITHDIAGTVKEGSKESEASYLVKLTEPQCYNAPYSIDISNFSEATFELDMQNYIGDMFEVKVEFRTSQDIQGETEPAYETAFSFTPEKGNSVCKVELDDKFDATFPNAGDEKGLWLYIGLTYHHSQYTSARQFIVPLKIYGRIYAASKFAKAETTMVAGGSSYEVEVNPNYADYSTESASDILVRGLAVTLPTGTKFTLDGLVRNLVPIGYFNSDVDGLTVNGVVQRRLMLPEGIPYVDVYDNMTDDEVIEGVAVFDYVFPSKTASVDSVSERQEQQMEEDEDGNKTPTGITYPIYTIKTGDFAGFSEEYVIGDDLTVTFQTGSLAGLTFGVAYLPDKSSSTEAAFEIVPNEDYGGQLPDKVMKPSDEDMFVMAGYDTEYMFSNLTAEAEQMLYQETLKLKEKMKGNKGTVTANIISTWAKEKYDEDGSLHPFAYGDKVTIDNKALFPSPITMRVIGYELNLDIPFNTPVYTIGESPTYSRLGALESKIDSVSLNGSKYVGGTSSVSGGGASLYVIKSNDTTVPKDTNVYSALRTDAEIDAAVKELMARLKEEFLKRLEPDTAQGLIKFMAGLEVGDAVDSMLAGRGILADVFGRMQLTNLEVRGSMTVMDLVINEIHAMAGDYSFTDAGAITAVEDLGNGTYRLWLRKDTDYDVTSLDVNDIVYSIINNLKLGGTDYKTSWMRVLAKNTTNNTLTVLPYPDDEVPGGTNYPPQAGYNLTRRGNTTLPETGQTNERAQAWLLSSREGRIMFLANVYKPILEDYNYALTIGKLPDIGPVKRLGVPTGAVGVMTEYLIAEKTLYFDYNGDVVPQMVERGVWSLEVAQSDKPYRNVSTSIPEAGGTTYTLLSRDVVTHVGCRWACLIDKTQLEPKWNSAGWEMIEGDTRYTLTFESSRGSAFFVGGVDTVLTARVHFGQMDITEEVMALAATEVEWARDSGNESMDRSWTPEYAEGNNSIHLTDEDMPIGFGSTVRTLAFICRVFIPVGEETLPVEGRIGISI